MRYAAIEKNDYINGEGICVSLWVQGCPHHCEGCHNPETWDFYGGKPVPNDIKEQIIKAISANGIVRNFSILGGEPLCDQNISFVDDIISAVRIAYPDIKIFVWTGYYLGQIKNPLIDSILKKIDVLIDGPYYEPFRDITLKLRGSFNQRILEKGIDFAIF